jgi:chemotaxis protein CheD
VALFDGGAGVAGLNHFMLPGELQPDRIYASGSGKYGMYAMELLINEMIKLGGAKKSFTAKVFGGGKVLRSSAGFTHSVPEGNIAFAISYLKQEGIPIASQDVGGSQGRRILFFTEGHKVLVKKLTGQETAPVESEESLYYSRIRREEEKRPDMTLF